MTGERWSRIERIYHAALEQPARDRDAFIRKEAGEDAELVAEIAALLAYDERPAAFMQRSAIELAARSLVVAQRDGKAQACSGAIGSYEILRTLGAGGMGEVYLARDTRLARNVALKVMRPDLPHRDLVVDVRHEALAASALNHPNILTIYEIGEHEGIEFIATEHVEGATLRERLKSAPISAGETIGIALQIAEGLAAAHEAGVVHRDIKPENVMLRADGLVKILDFGIATRTQSDRPRVSTATGPHEPVVGTQGYMSPEQIRGIEVDARTDLWSLGVVLHEMATGRLPAASRSAGDPRAAVSSASAVERDPLISIDPPELAEIVRRALSSEITDRYNTARELAHDLRDARRALEDRSHAGVRYGGRGARLSHPRRPVATLMVVLSAATAGLLAVAARSPGGPLHSLGIGPPPRQPAAGGDETRDPAAYQLYAKGRYHVLKRTPADLRKGMEYLREAVEADPTYARAHAKLADAHILLAMTSDVPPRESFPPARTAAERALAIDPMLSEARVSMGIIKFWYDWDWSGAEAEFKRALRADTPDPAAHTFYGHLLSNLGDHASALEQMRRALDYQPHSAVTNALYAQCFYYQRRYDESLALLHKTLELDPELWLTHNMIGRNYERKGMYEEALRAFDRAIELGGSTVLRASAAYTLAASGSRDQARRILDELEARSATTYVPPSNLALVHLGLGEYNEALDWLEKAYDARDMMLTFLIVEPKWAELAGQPRFTNLLNRMGLTL